MVSDSNVDHYSHKYNHRLNANSAAFRDADNQANFRAFGSVNAEVHLEPGTQLDRLTKNVNSKQNCVTGEDDTYMNFAEKRHSVQQSNLLLSSTSHDVDDYLVPVNEPTQLNHRVSREESITYDVNPRSNEDYCEDNVYMSLEDIHAASRVSGEDQAMLSVADKQPVAILPSETVAKGRTDVNNGVKSVGSTPVCNSVNERRISDVLSRKSTDGSLYQVQPEFTGSLSLGEIITDTQGTGAWTDLDTAAESVAGLPIYNAVHEDRSSDVQRHKSLNHMQSSFAPSVCNGEVSVDLLKAGSQSLVRNGPNSAPSQAAEQPASNPGS